MYYFMLLIILFTIKINARESWIDPFSIDIKESVENAASCSCKNENIENDFVIKHYQRSLNLLLNILKYDEEADSYSGKLYPTLSSEEHSFLKDFSNLHADNPNNWRKIDNILGRIYSKNVYDKSLELLFDLQERLFETFFRREALVILCSLIFIVFSYNLFTQKLNLKIVFSYLCFIFYIIDFSFTWIRLLQEKEIEKIINFKKHESLPPYCDPSQMTSFNYVKYKLFWGSKECENIHKSQYLDDFWVVSPLKVIATQFGSLIETPAESIGSGLGKLFNSIIEKTTWYNLPFIPLIMFFAISLIVITLTLLTGTSFGFNFFHCLQFNVGESRIPQPIRKYAIQENTSKIEDIKLLKNNEESAEVKKLATTQSVEVIKSVTNNKVLEIETVKSLEVQENKNESPKTDEEDKKDN